jgi:predicted signal transduction protein with EAL and GGDEF domain
MGRTLNRTVVVEGVETDAVVQALRRLGCTHAQGYHLGVRRTRSRSPIARRGAVAGASVGRGSAATAGQA